MHEKMLISRREFISILSSLPALTPLSLLANNQTSTAYIKEPWLTLSEVQQHLFPQEKSSIGARDIQALEYLRATMNAPDFDNDEKKLIHNGVSWLNDLSKQTYTKVFVRLDDNSKEKILRRIEGSRAGERWLSTLLTYLLEALVTDPVYGGNPNGIGWKWLQHQPGSRDHLKIKNILSWIQSVTGILNHENYTSMSVDYDVCIIGSGAGGGPVALELAKAGKSVLVLEKGPWLTEKDFYKDELACCVRNVYSPSLKDEKHVIEEQYQDGSWQGESTEETGWDFWNGNVVGGSSNFMSGFFYRLKPKDFRLLSEFGPIKGANIADWPISYDDLEPYYTKAEKEIGISGVVQQHKHLEPRSTKHFPYPATAEHPIVNRIDKACEQLGYSALKTPRAVLPKAAMGRQGCEYSGYCGSYGCSSGAKGSSRAALLNRAIKTGNCKIQPNAKVVKLESNHKGNVVAAKYFDENNIKQTVSAKIFIVACQAIETSRLLLSSTGPKHPKGLGNNNNQLGKNLLFSAGGSGTGEMTYSKLDKQSAEQLKIRGPFVNRGIQDWYFIDDKKMGGKAKGGIIDFLLRHPNAMSKANSLKWDDNGKLVWGKELKQKLKSTFTTSQDLRFEVFNDWLPTDNCFVSLDNKVNDKWNSAVAKIRIGYHEHDLKVGDYLSQKALNVLKKMGADNIRYNVSGSPPANLVAGGCRFGNDIKISVLDADCKVHDVDNLYVTDGSFMPTGGSVPYTWTIYANSFRVADIIKKRI